MDEFLRGYTEDGRQPASRVPAPFAVTMPADTLSAATVAAGVRLEFRGTTPFLDLRFEPGPAPQRAAPTMPAAFSVWLGERLHVLVDVAPDDTLARITLPRREADETVVVYLPEPLSLRLTGLSATEGTLVPAPRGPRWLAYGDSITQGWSASEPGRTWPSLVARRTGLDLVNLGFAGAARGEHPAAAHLAASHADIITLAWGTNCWSTIPFDAALMEQVCRLFLLTVREGHPDIPIVVLSPIVRPDAEHTPNRYGATLSDLRTAIESTVDDFRRERDDKCLRLLEGAGLIDAALLVDGIHPGDTGHARLADEVVKHMSVP